MPATATAGPRQKLTAEERREAVIQAAMIEFADAGLFGTSTEAIAARAGISQPYIFRLFGSKQNLFLVTAERCFRRILETFQAAAATTEGDPFPVMAEAYQELLSDRRLLMVWMHTFAACSIPVVQECVAAGFAEMYQFLEGLPGATPETVSHFMTCGMFLNVAAATNMRSAMTDEQWARRWLG
ncbi:MAG: TetR/AcrR family transcriptional regulator [Candidatus Dormibacteraeota bacterium]|nr:TetR/AcrR family transcriptional regulator [Candidatus Dormibacteraeota bacterium]